MRSLRFIYFYLLIPLFCIAFGSAYAEPAPEQAVDLIENQASVTTVNAEVSLGTSTTPTSILEILELPTDFEQTAALYALLADSSIEELKQLVLEAKTIVDTSDRHSGLSIIYGRFADLDPQQALSHLLSGNIGNSNNILSSMFFSWAKLDLNKAIEQCRSLSSSNHQQTATRAILKAHQDRDLDELGQIAAQLGPMAVAVMRNLARQKLANLAQSDPQAAVKEALETKDPNRRDDLVAVAANNWATQDPAAALEYGENMEAGEEQRIFRMSVLAAMARQDPEGMLDLIDSGFVNNDERYSLIYNVMWQLIQIDPQYALEEAQSLSREQDRLMAVSNVLDSMAQTNLETAIAMLESLPDPSALQQFGQQAVNQFTRSDPERALKWAEAHSAEAPMLLNQVVTAIAMNYPEYALELIADMPSSPTKSSTLHSVLSSMAHRDPLLAASYLKGIPKGPMHQQIAQNIASSWFRHDTELAIAWIFSLDRQLQSRLLIDFASHVVGYDLAYAQNLLPQLPSAQVRQAWISAMVYHLPKNNDPDVAVEWLEQYKDEAKYNDWMSQLLGVFAGRGSVEYALQLADNINGDAEYDSAILSIVSAWSVQDIRAAANWVQHESVTSNRNQLIQTVVARWVAQDLKSAQRWVMKFPDSEQRDLGLSALMVNEYISAQEADNILRKMISPTLRFNALESYIRNLARYDSSSARLFLRRQIVLSDQKDSLLRVIEDIENGVN